MDNLVIKNDVKEMMNKVDLSSLTGKKVLITGATGLIGTYLLYSIAEQNKLGKGIIKTTIVIHQELPEYLEALAEESWLIIRKGDLVDSDFLMALERFDVIIHGAGYAQPGKFMENKEKTLLLNTWVTRMLLERVVSGGKFLYLSTSEIYSGSTDIPYREDTHGVTMPDHPRSCYIEGKRSGETFCHIYGDVKGLDVKIARISLAYGPGVRKEDKRVLYNFIAKATKGDIQMLDAGRARRVYCYVTDIVECLWNILVYGKERTYNVGGESEVSICELAELVASQFEVQVIKGEEETGLTAAPETVWMDISKVKTEFHKSTYISIEEGIRRTTEWYKQYF